ncbi:MAG: RtcB family protein [Spirochaetaceae bacterium]|nr:RtcB family protein [Spirochaetaceae bacterium]
MIEIQGRYNIAKVFTDEVDSDAYAQILQMMNMVWSRNMSVRIMPDVHAGKGCTVGTTMTVEGKIVPNLVGIDIGCGVDVLVVKKDFTKIPLQELLEKLDRIIHSEIPSGKSGRTREHRFTKEIDWNAFIAPVDVKNAKLKLGSLGGGNHFIEADRDDDGNFYFVIHSGSRHLGKEVCDYYQDIAIKYTKARTMERGSIITKLKNEGREAELEAALAEIDHAPCSTELSYVEGDDLSHYLYDMELAQKYAALNRSAMLDVIKTGLEIKKQDVLEEFSTIHNYIDIKNKILRKGAISAQKGERVIIPMNMRDGSLICTGRGNHDWNCSAPHGAGRLYKRGEAKEMFSLEEYQKQMEGIYSSSVVASTIDESPMAYKPMEQILEKIEPTVEVVKRIKPVYNFKASSAQ